MTDLEVYVNTRGFLEYLLDRREIYRGDAVSIAGDLRPSTERILRAVARAITDGGFRADYLGRLPTPALLWSSLLEKRASVMVTGSHIPFDRNGVKFGRPIGEVMKLDEAGILAAVAGLRVWEYARKEGESPFGDDGMFLQGKEPPLPESSSAGSEAYLRRYLDFFPEDALSGKRVVLYQHSAVGRDLLVGILRSLGAEVLPMERSAEFIPIDTEDVSDARLRELERLAAVATDTLGRIDAIVSTDGDSDRPLVVGITEEGAVRFYPGDLLGTLVATYLRADAVVVPVSANDAVDLWFEPRGVLVRKTRIGSPFVIEGMEELLSRGGYRRIVGFEANGGFLTGSDLERGGRWLAALPTRDAVLPILCVLHLAAERGLTLPELFAELPPRFGKAGLLDGIPPKTSRTILKRLSSEGGALELASVFSRDLGFGSVLRSDTTDGLRLFFDNGDIAHIRPSGNAPQLRIYAVASTDARANEIVRHAVAEPDGILRKLARGSRDSK
jgi:phosphomannomutase